MAPTSDFLGGIRKKDFGFIAVAKNPYAWLLSMYRRPYHAKNNSYPDLLEFITNPWETMGRENHNVAFKDPVEMWNEDCATSFL